MDSTQEEIINFIRFIDAKIKVLESIRNTPVEEIKNNFMSLRYLAYDLETYDTETNIKKRRERRRERMRNIGGLNFEVFTSEEDN